MTSFPQSLWAATATPLGEAPPLTTTLDTRVCVIGAGFAGLSTALHLVERGIECAVVDAHQPGWGASGRNGGQVIPGLKHDPKQLLGLFGDAAGERLVRFAGDAPALLFGLIARHGIACDAVQVGWIQPAHAPEGLETIRRRAQQWRAFGADIVDLDAAETKRLIGSEHYHGAMLDRRGGSIQPLSFARGLARAAMRLGATIHGDSPAVSLARRDGRWHIETPRGLVRAERVVVATNAYTDDLVRGLRRSVVPVYSFQAATQPLDPQVLATIFPEGHAASDTRRLLRYFRKDAYGRLIMGGRGFPKDDLEPHDTRVLQRALKEIFPQIGDVAFDYHWGGRVAMTTDHLPHVHALADGLYAGLGFNGRGVAMATATGSVLARLAAGEPLADMPLPVTRLKPMAFHSLHSPAVHTLTAYYRWLDMRERRRAEARVT